MKSKIGASHIWRRALGMILLLMAAGVAGTAHAAEPASKPEAPRDRPNILFCVADDWGWPHAGAYGDAVVKTPAFDRLAQEGVLFLHAFVSSPSCTPSRNAMLTGQQFYRLGQGANLHSTLDPEEPNFMRLLREAGYEIGHWRKAWGPGKYRALGYKEHPCGPGMRFEKFVGEWSGEKPFCFWFGTSDPHRGYEEGSGRARGMDLSKIRVPAFLPDNETVRSDIADYYFEVERWNRDVAAALELLEKRGELENTIVVMTGDHGMPFPRCKGNLYDWGSRVPLAIRWSAGIEPGQRVGEFVSLTDLAPTFLELAGVRAPEKMTGRSLVPLFEGRGGGQRDAVIFGRERHVPAQEIPSMAGYPSRAIRTERFLYIMNLEPERWPAGVPDNATHPMNHFADCDNGPTKRFLREHGDEPEYRRFYELCFAPRPGEELYDVAEDPDQIRNLAGEPEYREVAEKLRARLTAYLKETGDPRFTGEPARFDEYPYRADYLERRLEQWREEGGVN